MLPEKETCQHHSAITERLDTVEENQRDYRGAGGVMEKIYNRLDTLVTVKTFMWTIVICTTLYSTVMASVYGFTLSVNQDVKNLTTQVQKETVCKQDLNNLKADLKEMIMQNMDIATRDREEIKKDLKELKRR